MSSHSPESSEKSIEYQSPVSQHIFVSAGGASEARPGNPRLFFPESRFHFKLSRAQLPDSVQDMDFTFSIQCYIFLSFFVCFGTQRMRLGTNEILKEFLQYFFLLTRELR